MNLLAFCFAVTLSLSLSSCAFLHTTTTTHHTHPSRPYSFRRHKYDITLVSSRANDYAWKRPDRDTTNDDISAKGQDPEKSLRLLPPRLHGTNVYLVGMMGSGKTSVGEVFCRGLGCYSFVDLDDVIETATKTTIPEIFKAEGESGFRAIESSVLNEVKNFVRCVISTGGGVVMDKMNWAKMQSGLVVYLQAEPSLLYERLKEGDPNRPLLSEGDPLGALESIYSERKSLYEQADVTVPVGSDDTIFAVVEKISAGIHKLIDENPPEWQKNKEKAKEDGIDWVH